MPQSTLRRPEAHYGAYGAYGADFFFFFSRPHPGKKARRGGISVAWHGTIFVVRNWCRPSAVGFLSLAMDEAAKELARQLARRQTIAELLVPARAAVEADKEANKGVRSCRA